MASSSTSTVNSGRALRSRTSRRLLVSERVRHKRHVLQDMARPLKQWLIRHRENPYPSKAEKVNLALGSHMTLVQVNNWFANARRRLKNVVRIPDVPWSQRIKLYNSHVEGNAELLSISSTDSIWEEDHSRPKSATLHLADEHSYSATDSSTSEETSKGGTTKHMLERYLRDAWRNSYDSDANNDLRSPDSTDRYWEELDAALTLTRLAWQRQ